MHIVLRNQDHFVSPSFLGYRGWHKQKFENVHLLVCNTLDFENQSQMPSQEPTQGIKYRGCVLFDSELKLVYRGQLDDSRPGNTLSINGTDVLHAVQCMTENKVNMRPQKPSIGCNIKWKTN